MRLITVTIGRNVPFDSSLRLHSMTADTGEQVPMRRNLWADFQLEVKNLLRVLPGDDTDGMATVFGPFGGTGEWEGVPEESVTFTALTTHPDFRPAGNGELTGPVEAFGDILSSIAHHYGQDAIAWSHGPALLAKG